MIIKRLEGHQLSRYFSKFLEHEKKIEDSENSTSHISRRKVHLPRRSLGKDLVLQSAGTKTGSEWED